MEEAAGKVENLDVAYWTGVFSAAGYTNHAGFKKIADAIKPKLATLEPEAVVAVAEAFHK